MYLILFIIKLKKIFDLNYLKLLIFLIDLNIKVKVNQVTNYCCSYIEANG